jgi:hypothetical protein
MSQYIPGIVQYVPQVQPYRPDLNFYQQVLQTKQAQYKAGYDQLSGLYGNLLESPMLRTENIDLRNKFFNQISAEISKISSMDLSLPQNVEAASKVFQPLIDNKYIMKDMAYTKQAYGQLRQADNFRNCTDEKKCGGKYWEGGVRAIHYQMGDFAKSGAEESLNFTAPRYTPAVNIAEKAMKFAKDMGFNMQTVSWSPDGNYKITTKNGQQMIPSLTDAFLATFQNDQAARDYYNTRGYLNRKDFIDQNAATYGSEEAAEAFYLDSMSNKLFETSQKSYDNTQKDIQTAKNKQTVYDQVISQRGIDPNDPDDQKIAGDRNQAMVDQMISQAAGDQYKQTQEKVDPGTINIVGIEAKRQRIDNAIADAFFTNDLAMSAESYAMLTMEQEVDEDKFALSRYDHGLAMARMAAQHQYDIEKDNLRTANDLLVKSYGEGANGGTFEGQSANGFANAYSPDPGGTGAGGAAKEANLIASDEKVFLQSGDNMTNSLTSYAQTVNAQLNNILRLSNGAALAGSGIKVTPELKKWAKEKQMELFGQAQEYEQWVEDPSEGLGLGGKMANWFLSEENEYKGHKAVKKLKGGYLDANGELKDLSAVEDFHSSPDNGWFQLGQKLNNFTSDPYTAAVLGKSVEIPYSKGAFNQDQKNYFAYLDQLKRNKKEIHGATIAGKGSEILTNTMQSPEYSKKALDVLFSDGKQMTEPEFVKWYTENRPTKGKELDLGFTTTWYGAEKVVSGETLYKDEAKKLYRQYKERYERIYNRADDAEVKDLKLTAYAPLQYGLFAGPTGAGVESMPVSVRGVDSAYRGDLGAKDFMSLYTSLPGLKSAKFYNTDGREITDDFLTANPFGWEGESLQNQLSLIYSHMTSGKKKTDNDRARFDMTIHPIIGNTTGKVGFTIKMDSEFLQNNQGNDKTPKALRDSNGIVTVVMDAADAEQIPAYQRLKKGSYQIQMDSYKSINIDQYGKAGSIQITPSRINPNAYNANGTINYIDESGVVSQMEYNVESNPGQTADTFGAQQEAMLRQHYIDIVNAAEELRRVNPNLIKDPNMLMQ